MCSDKAKIKITSYDGKSFTTEREISTEKLTTINELNTRPTPWSHVDDDIETASVEINYRDTVELSEKLSSYARYRDAWYPRIKKIRDDLYLLLFMPGQYGGKQLYYATSADAKNWNAPMLLWDEYREFIHTEGPLKDTTDKYFAVNPDACVLENGEIIAVYEIRPNAGYIHSAYLDLNGVYMKRGIVQNDDTIVWGEQIKLTHGQAWEPFIRQRYDGRVEVYWSNLAAYVEKYGFDRKKGSTGTSMIYSDDNGYTWIPDIEDGKKNNYMYIRAYQEKVGDKIPAGVNEDGSPKYTQAVPYFGGQMPSAASLYNKKTLLAIEVHYLDNTFHTSLTTSEDGGNWGSLAMLEDYSETHKVIKHIDGAAPYLSVFESGEAYLTYNVRGKLRARLVSADGERLKKFEFTATPDAKGCWGSSELVGSHKVLSVFPNESSGEGRGIFIYTSYLNHRINAMDIPVVSDGNTEEWKENTDALFVGSEGQAQMTVQVAHHAENVFFLVNRLDRDITDGDTITLMIGTEKNKYSAFTLDTEGIRCFYTFEDGSKKHLQTRATIAVKTFGSVNDSTDVDEGILYELAVPKDALGIDGAGSFKICPVLHNVDAGGEYDDTFDGVELTDTDTWPTVVLDD